MRAILICLALVPVLVLAILATHTIAPSAASEGAPYLYYYSDLLNSFVIERSDGTDSRTLAAGVMPEDYNYVSGPGWSPSGEWFAWTGAHVAGGGTTFASVWVISADGTRSFLGLEDVRFGEFGGISWSPFEDKLLVEDDMQLFWDQGSGYVYTLLDVDTGQIISTFQLDGSWPSGRGLWSPDGQYLMLYQDSPDTDDEAQAQTFLRTISTSGEIQDRKINGEPISHIYLGLDVSSTGWFLYHSPGETTLIGENIISGERLEFDPLPDRVLRGWSPSGTYALLWHEETAMLSLLSITENQIFPIAEHIHFDMYGDPAVQWSPMRDWAVFVSSDGQLKLLDASTHQVVSIVDDVENIRYDWEENGDLLMVETEQNISLYDPASRTIRNVAERSFLDWAFGVNLSPDSRYLALSGRSPSIMDTTSEQINTFMPFSGAPGWYVSDYRWHPDSGWVFAAENVSFAGGGGGPEGVSVLKADGTLHRELTVIEFSTTGVNWLPDRVIPYLAPGSSDSVIQQPLVTLEHDGEVWGVAWKPDGLRIASYVQKRSANVDDEVHIWEMSGSAAVHANQFSFPYCGDRPTPCELTWSPDGRLIGANSFPSAEIWDPNTGTLVAQLQDSHVRWTADGYEGLSILQAYSPDGTMIAERDYKRKVVEVRQVTSGELVLSIPEVDGPRLTWSPTGQQLAVEESMSVVRLWNIETGDSVALELPQLASTWDSVFSPDGELFALSSYWYPIAIFDTSTGELVQRLNWYAKAIDFSPDGTRLAAAGSWAVTIWDVSDINAR